MTILQPRNASLIVRIWWEHPTDGAPFFRGQAKNVFTGESIYFEQLTALQDFACRSCGCSTDKTAAALRPTQESDVRAASV